MRLVAHRRSGLVAVGASVVAGYGGYHRWQVRWGATAQEVAEPLPGDDVADRAWWSATRAITINAAPAQVWPWLVQMGGYTRAGWYSYDWIDNAGRPSANRIVPELQDLTVGDILPMSSDGSGFRVQAIDPGRSLVLVIPDPDAAVSSVFVLREAGPDRTRLVTRLRIGGRPTVRTLAFTAAMDAGDFVMFRRTLLGIRDRAERLTRSTPGAADPEDLAPGRPLEFDLAIEIRRPPEVVYAFLVAKERHPQPPGSPVLRLDRLTPGPARVGTRWIEVVRVGPGMSMTVRSQADQVEPGVALGERFTSAWFTGRLAYTFEPIPAGTRLRQHETLRPRGPLALLAGPIDATLRPRLLSRLVDIRDLLEDPLVRLVPSPADLGQP
jgi:uncharacterized protein YndB with AHSA1/START domain